MPKKTQKKKVQGKKQIKKDETSAKFVIDRIYNASVEKVWNALTINDEIKQWYFDFPEFKPEIGFKFQFMGGKDQNNLYKHLCEITAIIPGKKLSYSWQYEGYEGYSVVTFELESLGSKTKVTLTHEGINTFPQDNEDLASKNFAEGWTFIVTKSLKEFVEYKKLVMFNMMTLDGYFEGKNKWELDWHNVDAEFNEFAINQLHEISYIVFGRLTYEGMAGYWPSDDGKKDDPIVAELMNKTPKIVFSSTLTKAEWENTTVLKGDMQKELLKLKEKSDKDLILMGSANLSGELMKLGLIDEYRIMINPIILGSGTQLFKDFKQKLKLISVKKFSSGNVLLTYKPIV